MCSSITFGYHAQRFQKSSYLLINADCFMKNAPQLSVKDADKLTSEIFMNKALHGTLYHV